MWFFFPGHPHGCGLHGNGEQHEPCCGRGRTREGKIATMSQSCPRERAAVRGGRDKAEAERHEEERWESNGRKNDLREMLTKTGPIVESCSWMQRYWNFVHGSQTLRSH